MYTRHNKQVPQPAFGYDQRVQWDENDFLICAGSVIHVAHDILGNPTTMFLVRPDDGSKPVFRSINSHNLRPEENEVLIW